EVLGGIVLLGPEDRPDLVYFLATGRHHHLLVELRALVEERLLVKVSNREKFGAAFGGCGHDLRGGDIGEPGIVEVLVDCVERGAADLEDGGNTGPPHIEEP